MHIEQYAIPKDVATIILLAKVIVSMFDRELQVLLHIKEWSVWPSTEHMPLYSQLRLSYRETTNLIDKPGHLFNQTEMNELLSCIIIGLIFSWDCEVYSLSNATYSLTSHDGIGLIYGKDSKERFNNIGITDF